MSDPACIDISGEDFDVDNALVQRPGALVRLDCHFYVCL